MKNVSARTSLWLFILLLLSACKTKNTNTSPVAADSVNLRRGEVVLCGPPAKQFGSVVFDVSCPAKVKNDFNLAMALLHSFEYDESEKVFAKIIEVEPGCAMAYWGVAMCNYHPIWLSPTEAELKKGSKAVEMARSVVQKTGREADYIEAVAAFYKDWEKIAEHTRCVNFERAMEMIYRKYPGDKEAAIFYALALDGAADPADKSFINQKKAGAILNAIYPGEPNHPGIVHYIIHSYDYPGLAELALPAARKYASIAPASAHAQHMPSHIFTRLGLWDECIQSNLTSTAYAKCYAENTGIKGHWDEELHGMDYLQYAYLQKAETGLAKQQWDYLRTIKEVYPANFKVAYAFAAIPSRYVLENKMWKDAAALETYPVNFPWEKFPWQKAIIYFTRILGDVHIGHLDSARVELEKLMLVHDTLTKRKDLYKANQVEIQIKAAGAWILFKERKNDKALTLMHTAADMEDATQKSPVTPGEVIPVRELLADMFMEMGYTSKALQAYGESLKTHPNRFNSLYGAGIAAEKSGDILKAKSFYHQLSNICAINSTRPELSAARLFLKK
jgi:tetratricopeptide (TPR) repeat protein